MPCIRCRVHMFLPPRHSWQEAQICMDTLKLVPIRKTAEQSDVSVQCAFNNRHTFLSLLEEIPGKEKELMAGTTQWFHCHITGESLKEQHLFRINASYSSIHTHVGELSILLFTIEKWLTFIHQLFHLVHLSFKVFLKRV